MHTRRLGNSDIQVSGMGLGCMGMSQAYGTADDRDDDISISVIHRAIDLGVTLIDTADMYGPWHNEKLVGRALKGRRDQVTVATKCGFVHVDPDRGKTHPDARPVHIKMCIDASLRRLDVDVIDLYQLHRPDPTVPIEESIGAMAELVEAGKVRSIGVSEFDVEQLDKAVSVHPITSLQSEMSLWTRDVLTEILPWCVEHDVAFIPFAPLGRGFLTGALTSANFDVIDTRSRSPRFADGAFQQNQAIVDQVRAVANGGGWTAAQVAIAWTLRQGDQVIPIPGTKRISYLEENLGAADVVLTDADMAALDALPSPVGARY